MISKWTKQTVNGNQVDAFQIRAGDRFEKLDGIPGGYKLDLIENESVGFDADKKPEVGGWLIRREDGQRAIYRETL